MLHKSLLVKVGFINTLKRASGLTLAALQAHSKAQGP